MGRFILTRMLEYYKVNIDLDTKVLDTKGKPMVMYHGGSYNGGEFKGDVWFTSGIADAKYYAKQNHGVVTKAYLIIKNPFYAGDVKHLDLNYEDFREIIESHNMPIGHEDGKIHYIEPNCAVILAKKCGNDGVIDLHNGLILDCVVFNDYQIVQI